MERPNPEDPDDSRGHPLSDLRYQAREQDPSSPFIWGHAARMLMHGGPWDLSKPVAVSLKRPRTMSAGYEGEYLTEPNQGTSSASTTGSIVRQMLLAGFTAAEAADALEDPNNVGGQFWRWVGAGKHGEEFQTQMLEGRTLDRYGQLKILPVGEPYKVKVTVNSFHPCPLLTVVDAQGEVHKIKVNEEGKISLPTHMSSPLDTHMGRKEVLGAWEGSNGFKVDIHRDKVVSIVGHLQHRYTPTSQANLKRDLSPIIRTKGILDGYLKWLAHEGYLSWADEVHPITLTNGNIRKMRVKVPHLTGKSLPARDLTVSTFDIFENLDDNPLEYAYLTDPA